MKYKIRFTTQSQKKMRSEDGCDVFTVQTLPFLPRKDDMLAVVPEDNLRKVKEIYWSHTDGFEVYLEPETDTAPYHAQMIRMGWKAEK